MEQWRVVQKTKTENNETPFLCNSCYTGTQVALWDFQNKGRSRWTGTSCFVWEFPLCNLCPSLCDCVQYHVTRSCKGRTDTNDKTTDAEAWKTDVKHIASEVDCSPEHFAVDGNK